MFRMFYRKQPPHERVVDITL